MNVSRVIQSWNERKKNENLILSYDSTLIMFYKQHCKWRTSLSFCLYILPEYAVMAEGKKNWEREVPRVLGWTRVNPVSASLICIIEIKPCGLKFYNSRCLFLEL